VRKAPMLSGLISGLEAQSQIRLLLDELYGSLGWSSLGEATLRVSRVPVIG
jgi:hypothetical protein